ncbi:DUF3938 domain-containing protein, partial [Bacillus thuringiensis]
TLPLQLTSPFFHPLSTSFIPFSLAHLFNLLQHNEQHTAPQIQTNS